MTAEVGVPVNPEIGVPVESCLPLEGGIPVKTGCNRKLYCVHRLCSARPQSIKPTSFSLVLWKRNCRAPMPISAATVSSRTKVTPLFWPKQSNFQYADFSPGLSPRERSFHTRSDANCSSSPKRWRGSNVWPASRKRVQLVMRHDQDFDGARSGVWFKGVRLDVEAYAVTFSG